MQRALGETGRRRHKQQTYNEAHGITPRGVVKRIKNIVDTEELRDEPKKLRESVVIFPI